MDDIQKLLIERACERLMIEYCHLVDHGEAARIADQFTEDGVWCSSENTMTGRAEIARGFQRRQDNTGRMSRHVCSNPLIEVIDKGRARGVVYLTLHRDDGPVGRRSSPMNLPEVVGEYRDTFALTHEGWRFSRRDVVADFVRRDAPAPAPAPR